MIKKVILIVTSLSILSLKAQVNLVPNPSFEDTVHCPDWNNELSNAKYWDIPGWSGSSDFFHTCNTGRITDVGIPRNIGGYQYPATGNGYAGIFTYGSDFGVSYREYLMAKLTDTMQVGQLYYIRFKVSRAYDYSMLGSTGSANNKLGVKFTTFLFPKIPPPGIPPFVYPDNWAHFYSNTIITDTTNWVVIDGSFVADSAYQYIVLGNFFDDEHTNCFFGPLDLDRNTHSAYYYVDDICVSTSLTTCIEQVLNSIEELSAGSAIDVAPNPTKEQVKIRAAGEPITSIKLLNLQGNEVMTVNAINAPEYVMDLATLPAGVYFFKINMGNATGFKRLIKQ